jgi:hypothetical protein
MGLVPDWDLRLIIRLIISECSVVSYKVAIEHSYILDSFTIETPRKLGK